MSLMAKLKGQWRGDVDDIRDAIIENLSAVLSARAPMWQNTELSRRCVTRLLHSAW